MTTRQTQATHSRAGSGDRYLLLGTELITFRLRGEHYTVFENVTQPGYAGPPPHRHLTQDEGWYVMEGAFTFEAEGLSTTAGPGTFVNVPKGLLHTFRNTGSTVGRLIGVVAPPGDFEAFVAEVGQQADIELPPPLPPVPPDQTTIAGVVSAAQKHRIELAQTSETHRS